ncbi:MAG: nickel pincer cofactor biosynthesis protein LarB [bacterium]
MKKKSVKREGLNTYDTFKFDHERIIRQGFPEVILGEGKRKEDILRIVKEALKGEGNILITKTSKEVYLTIKENNAIWHPVAGCITIRRKEPDKLAGPVFIATGGTGDIPIAEEAATTLEIMDIGVLKAYDVGVAGIHRLFKEKERLEKAMCVIVVAGMDGALASVVGGLVSVPVIAVPTSIGYGANFSGLAPLLTMLNSCAPGIGVVNIDNGFGAAYLAFRIIKGLGVRG